MPNLSKVPGERGLCINPSSGTYFVRVQTDEQDNFVTLDTKRKGVAIERMQARRAAKSAARLGLAVEDPDEEAKTAAVTVAAVIQAFQEAEYPDRRGNPRPEGVHRRCEEDNCDTLLSYFNRFFPADSSPHPIALLAHGIFCSKETLFRYGEALAAAGFICYAIDLPGHGESPRRFSLAGNVTTLEKVARRLGSVDGFIGYSMGGFAGGEAVRDGGMRPKLFIAVGSVPGLGEHAPPLLLLAGRINEFVPPAVLKARTDARLVISPWSDHALELYDPLLVDAAVKAACAAVGKTPPAAPTCWRWRLAGMALGMLGMFGMAKVGPMLCMPEISPRWAHVRGPLFSVTVIGAFALTSSTWLGAVPPLRRVPVQLAAAAMTWLVVMGAGRLGIPRWSFLALALAVWIGSLVAGASIIVLFAYFFMLALFPGTVIGVIAAHRGSRCDGDIAMAIAVGYALGQWIPRIL